MGNVDSGAQGLALLVHFIDKMMFSVNIILKQFFNGSVSMETITKAKLLYLNFKATKQTQEIVTLFLGSTFLSRESFQFQS